jgi:hypothetical protein
MSKSNYSIKALKECARYILFCNNKEMYDYLDFCDDNNLNPLDIKHSTNRDHIFVSALVGLGLTLVKSNNEYTIVKGKK